MARIPPRGATATARQASMDKVVALLLHAEGRPLSVADLRQAAGTSARTLRACFHERFGVGPHRYLHLRRMHWIRAALVLADAHHDTVSGIANRFGYADAGRMAADYRALFGEYPRQTLERQLSR